MSLQYFFPEEVGMHYSFIHKRPGGAKKGEVVYNTDIREVFDIRIPSYKGKYFFDFVVLIWDFTTQNYWMTNLWTQTVCPDLRYYLSSERRKKYRQLGLSLAESYNRTLILGHVNLKSGKLKQSKGINKLRRHGWIPTISFLPQPYGEMINIIEKTNDINQVNKFICDSFRQNSLIDSIIARWAYASLATKRIKVLTAAINHFKAGDYLSTVYLLLPQIEGLVTAHIKRRHQVPKGFISERFKQFGEIIKGEPYNTKTTKYLTCILVSHLEKAYFKTWYPYLKSGRRFSGSKISPQRNILLHGEIKEDYFTEENAIKLLCIIDNIILLSLMRSELPRRKKL